MTYYCRIDSSLDLEDTNLQLYSLQKAADEWNSLIKLINNNGINDVKYFKERLVFITNCFGLSLSQLIGQNNPHPDKEVLGQPGDLFSNLLNQSNLDRITKNRLNKAFRDFLTYYSDIRHFGIVKEDRKYKSIDKLTIDKLDSFRRLTIEIWDIIISLYRKDEKNEIEEFTSISDIIYFDNMNKKPSP
jgi:hypothetical protein